MPVSLLTPIASDLRMTEGLAGQAIPISGVFAVLVIAGVTAASLGGLLFDMRGYQSTFFVSAVLLCAAAYLAFKAGRVAGTL